MAEERDERTRELLRRAQLYNVSHHDKLARTAAAPPTWPGRGVAGPTRRAARERRRARRARPRRARACSLAHVAAARRAPPPSHEPPWCVGRQNTRMVPPGTRDAATVQLRRARRAARRGQLGRHARAEARGHRGADRRGVRGQWTPIARRDAQLRGRAVVVVAEPMARRRRVPAAAGSSARARARGTRHRRPSRRRRSERRPARRPRAVAGLGPAPPTATPGAVGGGRTTRRQRGDRRRAAAAARPSARSRRRRRCSALSGAPTRDAAGAASARRGGSGRAARRPVLVSGTSTPPGSAPAARRGGGFGRRRPRGRARRPGRPAAVADTRSSRTARRRYWGGDAYMARGADDEGQRARAVEARHARRWALSAPTRAYQREFHPQIQLAVAAVTARPRRVASRTRGLAGSTASRCMPTSPSSRRSRRSST